MTEIEIIWSPTALEHLRAIYDYILADNPVAAIDVHEEIERVAGLLKDNPRLGHRGRVENTREFVVPAYQNDIIVYEIEGYHINILALMHGKQQWPDRFGGC